MPNDTPDDGIGGSLSFDEAVNAYANPGTEEETGDGHAEPETEAEDDVEDQAEEAQETDEPEEEGQAEDEPEAPVAPAYVAPEAKVKLPDGEEMTVADLIKGNLRDRDYRQKTEAVAAERKAYTAKSEQIQQFEQQMAADRDFTVQLLQSIMPQKPDPAMYAADPFGFGQAKLDYDTRKEQLDYLVYQAQQTDYRKQAEAQESQKELAAREWQRTLEVMPELSDGTRLRSFAAEIQQHGKEYGYSPEELNNVGLDHRQLGVLKDAIAWRKLQASKSKVAAKVEGRPPVQRGGTRQSPQMQASRDARVAMDRLKSSGNLRDGVAALLALEKG